MPNERDAAFFLGANSPCGFRSLFERSYSAAGGWRVVIIKGGPGTGKSTLMRALAARAEERGEVCERIFCSSDPGSLDAVILPERRRAIYDGTPPHALEPSLPGACERLCDMGGAWDADLLNERREEIAALSAMCAGRHRRASGLLACAEHHRAVIRERAAEAVDAAKLDRAAGRLCERLRLNARGDGGDRRVRLASAVTPKGVFAVAEPHLAGYGRIVPIYDRWYAPSGRLLAAIRERLDAAGWGYIECPCSQEPNRLEHLLVPGADVCFTVRGDAHALAAGAPGETRAVHVERFLPAEFARDGKGETAEARREIKHCCALAAREMTRAKMVHDRLEEHYREAMDFSRTTQIAERAAGMLLED